MPTVDVQDAEVLAVIAQIAPLVRSKTELSSILCAFEPGTVRDAVEAEFHRLRPELG